MDFLTLIALSEKHPNTMLYPRPLADLPGVKFPPQRWVHARCAYNLMAKQLRSTWIDHLTEVVPGHETEPHCMLCRKRMQWTP